MTFRRQTSWCVSSVKGINTSPIRFACSVFPLRKALAHGVRVGLGTDIAGGPSASMFDAALERVRQSR